uniref:Clip domain-containing protein n=1 Tax=Panagrellus redivivus TaxID=6233 RepID=A0A7E4WCH1_PANRE
MGNSVARGSRPRKNSILEILGRMDTNLNVVEARLDKHFECGCPHGDGLRIFYNQTLQNARETVFRYKKCMLDQPWSRMCCDSSLRSEMYETVDEFIVLVNVHFANCPGGNGVAAVKPRPPLTSIVEEDS